MAELVRAATVVVCHGLDAASLTSDGSGFLVAPGRVLTCAHVVRDHSPLWIQWQGRTLPATVLAMEPRPALGDTVPAPDTAVLAVDGIGDHPCVPLADGDPVLDAPLWAYGISRLRTGAVEPDSSSLTFAGLVAGPQHLYKLQGGAIAKGLSGGPVVDRTRFQVCGMVKASLVGTGGYAVPIADALAVYPEEDLRALNLDVNNGTLAALRRAQVGLEPMVGLVRVRLTPSRAAAIAEGLEEPAVAVAPEDHIEWVARQMFRLGLEALVTLLWGARDVLGDGAAELLWMVGCCVPLDHENPDSYWIPAEAAAALRSEWDNGTPRVIRLSTGQALTRDFLVHRALGRKAEPLSLLPFSAASDGDLPADLIDDISRALAQSQGIAIARLNRDRARAIGMAIKKARGFGRFASIPSTALADRDFLAGLIEAFRGLLFIACCEDPSTEPVVAGSEDLVLTLRPPIESDIEEEALTWLYDFYPSGAGAA